MDFRIKLIFICAFILAVRGDSENQGNDRDLEAATGKFEQLLSAALQTPSRLEQRSVPFTVFENKLRDVSLHDGGKDFFFEDAAINWMSPVLVDSASPNLREGSVKVKSHWDVVAFSGVYGQRNEDEPLQLEVNLQNIEASGLAGYSLDKSVAVVENMDLSFSIGSLFIRNAQTGEQVDLDDNLQKIIGSYFEKDLSEILKQNLKDYLNDGLSEVLLEKVFDNDTPRIAKYRAAIEQRAQNADQLADFLLEVLKGYLEQNGLHSMAIPDISERFRTKWGIFKFNVAFDAHGGSVRDPTSIRRTGSFSIDGDFENDDFTLYGSIGFGTLAGHFNSYKAKAGIFGASGNVDVTVGRNAVSFSISGKLVDKVIKVKENFTFKINNFDDIKVKATGWSFAFNWLLNIIATKVMNNFKGTISDKLEAGVNDVLRQQLEKLNYEIPFGN